MSEVTLDWPQDYNKVPKEAFTRHDIYKAELEQIFYGPEWHPIAHAAEIPNKGDFKTTRLAEVPLIVTHSQDGDIRVFFNSCSHRGNQVETALRGNKTEFECPYHRWLFNTEGDLIGCPNAKEFSPGFEKKDYPLEQPRTELFMGVVFVTFSDKTCSLTEFLGELTSTFKDLLLGDGRLKLIGYQKVRYKSNWKSYNDNDGYHAPLLHKAFRMLNWQGGKGRQYNSGIRGHLGFESALTVATGTKTLKDNSILDFKGSDPSKGSCIVGLFPTFVATKHLDVCNLRFANPDGPDHIEVHYAYFAHVDDDDEMVQHRVRQSSNLLGPSGLVSMEDASIFHRIHIGNHTPGNAVFQKGVKDTKSIPETMMQNDETGQLKRWDYYREIMGFHRKGA